MRYVTAFVVVLTMLLSSTEAQTAPPLSTRAQTVKLKVDRPAAGSEISVVRVHAEEEFGTFVSSTETGFTFYDIDSKLNVTLGFEDVKKVKDGYGGYNSLRGPPY